MKWKETDCEILRLALPCIVSNITVPLLGLVDLAIDVTPTMEQKVLKASSGKDLFTSMQKVWPQYGLPDGIEILYERNCEKQ